jgi:hypothetical protein
MGTLARNRLLSTVITLTVSLTIASLAFSPLGAQDAARGQDKKSKVEKLLEERLATAREMARLASIQFKNLQGTPDQLREANRIWLEAELDACTSDKDRVTVLERFVGEARKLEEMAHAMLKAGQLQENRWLAVKADRLQLEIALERARAKPAKQPRGEAKPGLELDEQVSLADKQVAIKRAAVKVAEVQVQIAAAKVSSAKAQLGAAKASEAYAEQQMKRFAALAGSNAIPAELLDEQRAKLDAAKAHRAAVEGKFAESEGQVVLERARVEVSRLEAEEAELRLTQLKAKLKPAQ